MPIRFIFKTEKKQIMKQLKYYGIEKLPYLLISTGKEKIRAYSGELSTNEIIELNKNIGIELIGMYFMHNFNGETRLSMDAIHLLKEKITKNIIEINEKQAKEWFKGQDIILTEEDKEKWKTESKGFKIIKFKDDLIATGKLIEDRIVNYMPKERRDKK